MIENGESLERWHIPAADRRAWLCLTTGSSTLTSALSFIPVSSVISSPSLNDTSTSIEASIDIPPTTGADNIQIGPSGLRLGFNSEFINTVSKTPQQESAGTKSVDVDDINAIKENVQNVQFVAQAPRKLY